jgi:imidazole glycerol-phosphate synthase subunit HisF
MFRPRIIPVLLLKNLGLVKSTKFKNYNYIGDPINAVRIFNDLNADELVFLDIEASKKNQLISLDFVKNVGEEANMPFAVGGGIKTLNDIKNILKNGAEKVILNSHAITNPDFIKKASLEFGTSTISVCIDVKKTILGKKKVWSHCGTKKSIFNPLDFAKIMEENGAGELIIQSIEKDGTMTGYDLELIKSISSTCTIPITALGGAGNNQHLLSAYNDAYANGLAAGSLFVYQGSNKGVLINYPEKNELTFN